MMKIDTSQTPKERSHLVLPAAPLPGLVGAGQAQVLPGELHQGEPLGGHADDLDLLPLGEVEGGGGALQVGLHPAVIALDNLPGESGLHSHLQLDCVLH